MASSSKAYFINKYNRKIKSAPVGFEIGMESTGSKRLSARSANFSNKYIPSVLQFILQISNMEQFTKDKPFH